MAVGDVVGQETAFLSPVQGAEVVELGKYLACLLILPVIVVGLCKPVAGELVEARPRVGIEGCSLEARHGISP